MRIDSLSIETKMDRIVPGLPGLIYQKIQLLGKFSREEMELFSSGRHKIQIVIDIDGAQIAATADNNEVGLIGDTAAITVNAK